MGGANGISLDGTAARFDNLNMVMRYCLLQVVIVSFHCALVGACGVFIVLARVWSANGGCSWLLSGPHSTLQ